MVTRRTVRRTHLLRPEPRMNQLFTYCLAVLAKRHGILVHAAVLMSTHEHIVLTDTRGELPRFLQGLHRLLALGTKVLRKWEGAVWDHEKTSVVELLTPQAVAEKIAYVMANPVAAGLVERASHWPGIITTPDELGTARWTAERPNFYFDQQNADWPPSATLELVLPAVPIPHDEFRVLITKELNALEAEAANELSAKGRKVLGAKRVAHMSPFKRARSWEPVIERNPTLAVGRGCKDLLLAAIAALRSFRAAYREAREAWMRGIRSVAFPYGTYLMPLLHGVRVAAPSIPLSARAHMSDAA